MESIKKEYYTLSKKEIDLIKEVDKNIPNFDNFQFKFGETGLNYEDKKAEKVFFRIGIITSIISMSKKGLPMGIMITGGVSGLKKEIKLKFKISSENGENLSVEEEKLYEEFINTENIEDSLNILFSKLKPEQGKGIVIIGIDNMSYSKKMSEILLKGLKFIGNCSYNVYNDISCPWLFFLTSINQMVFEKIELKYKMVFSPQDNYWLYLNNSFNKFHSYYKTVFKNKEINDYNNNYENELCIDLSNGMGILYKNQINNILYNKENNIQLKINYVNDNNINNKKNELTSLKIKNASLSSDLDSILYYLKDNKSNKMKKIRGEKIIILFCKMINFLIDNFSPNLKKKYYEMIKMSIITSLYSNKAFISYCENKLNNYKICYVKTGMKNLQRESKKYDISLCYEYNGQGTIYINKEIVKKFGQLSCLIETSKDSQIIELFQLFIALFNVTTSDGIANLLIIESLLKVMNLSIKDVYNFYEEIPYKMIDVKINGDNNNKYNIVANEDETKLLEPKNIQDKIDEIMNEYKNCRVLIRPSHDDNYLMIYTESENDENNKKIIDEIKKYIEEKKE